MIVWVDDALFGQAAAHDVDRLALLRGAFLRRHTLSVSSNPASFWPGSRRAEHLERWVSCLSEGVGREVRLLLEGLAKVPVNATTRGGGRVLVSHRAVVRAAAGQACVIDLPTAVRVVGLPLAILVENIINDAAFLLRVMPRHWRETLLRWERDGELCFEHGGGIATMRQILERFGDHGGSPEPTPPSIPAEGPMPPNAWRLLRFLVFDHDGPSRAQPSGEAKRLARACLQHGMAGRFHMLRRKDPEAYLPEPALCELVELKVSDRDDRQRLMGELKEHFGHAPEQRDYRTLPGLGEKPLFKNEFGRSDVSWRDDWFADAAQEMTELAEMIAAAK